MLWYKYDENNEEINKINDKFDSDRNELTELSAKYF